MQTVAITRFILNPTGLKTSPKPKLGINPNQMPNLTWVEILNHATESCICHAIQTQYGHTHQQLIVSPPNCRSCLMPPIIPPPR